MVEARSVNVKNTTTIRCMCESTTNIEKYFPKRDFSSKCPIRAKRNAVLFSLPLPLRLPFSLINNTVWRVRRAFFSSGWCFLPIVGVGKRGEY